MAIELSESAVKLSYDVLGEDLIQEASRSGRMSVSLMLIEIEYSDAWAVTLKGVMVEVSGRKTKTKAAVTYGPDQIEDIPAFARLKFDAVMAEVKGVFA